MLLILGDLSFVNSLSLFHGLLSGFNRLLELMDVC